MYIYRVFHAEWLGWTIEIIQWNLCRDYKTWAESKTVWWVTGC